MNRLEKHGQSRPQQHNALQARDLIGNLPAIAEQKCVILRHNAVVRRMEGGIEDFFCGACVKLCGKFNKDQFAALLIDLPRASGKQPKGFRIAILYKGHRHGPGEIRAFQILIISDRRPITGPRIPQRGVPGRVVIDLTFRLPLTFLTIKYGKQTCDAGPL